MQSLVIAGLDPAIQSLDQSVKDWMPRSSRGMTWVGVGARWYNSLCFYAISESPNEFIWLEIALGQTTDLLSGSTSGSSKVAAIS